MALTLSVLAILAATAVAIEFDVPLGTTAVEWIVTGSTVVAVVSKLLASSIAGGSTQRLGTSEAAS